MHDELIVKQKTEELMNRVYPALVNFPKSEKHSLCLKIKESFFEILKYIYLGNSVKSKRKTYLQEADGNLQTLKVLIKLSHSQKYISNNFYYDISESLTEINKLLCGFIKSLSR